MTALKAFFLGDWQNKLIALGVAFVLWWVVSDMTDGVSDPFDVPVHFEIDSPHYVVLSPPQPTATIRISGPKGLVNDIVYQAGQLRAVHKLNVDPAVLELREPILDSDIRVPPGLRVDILSDPMTIALARVVPARLKVVAQLEGTPASGYEVVESVRTTPSEISLEAPSILLDRTDSVPTEPIDVSGRTSSFSLDQPLVSKVAGIPIDGVGPVRVQVEIRPLPAVREFTQIPVYVLAPPGYPFRVRFTGEGNAVALRLRGAESWLQTLAREDVKVWVDVSQDVPRDVPYQRTPQVILPKGVELVDVPEVQYAVEPP